MQKKNDTHPQEKKDSEATIVALQQQLEEAKSKEQRALADYQNLIRRTAQEKTRFAQMAALSFVSDLLEPLSHLQMASEQLSDVGLQMVVSKLWQTLEDHGLKRIDALGKQFNIQTMEAVEKGEHGQKVVKIVSDGYLLNNEVIKHAKVVLD